MSAYAALPIATAVTALFVPGNRPERFAKAAAAGADVVIIDLEDAVAPDERAEALGHVIAALSPGAQPTLSALVRVTDHTSSTYSRQVEALLILAARPGHGLAGLMIPKATDPSQIAVLATELAQVTTSPVPLVPLVESAAGVQAAEHLARRAGVARLAFGALDFSLDVGADVTSETVTYARAQVVIASRAAGIAAPLDTPSVEITDLECVSRAARTSRLRGFGGKLCIHPAQLAAVREAFRPTAEERRWAETVVAAGDDAVQIHGQMIDRPVLERARRIMGISPTS